MMKSKKQKTIAGYLPHHPQGGTGLLHAGASEVLKKQIPNRAQTVGGLFYRERIKMKKLLA